MPLIKKNSFAIFSHTTIWIKRKLYGSKIIKICNGLVKHKILYNFIVSYSLHTFDHREVTMSIDELALATVNPFTNRIK